jgi:hypothetical protein
MRVISTERIGGRQRVLLIPPHRPEAPELSCRNRSDPVYPARRETQIPIHDDHLLTGDRLPPEILNTFIRMINNLENGYQNDRKCRYRVYQCEAILGREKVAPFMVMLVCNL